MTARQVSATRKKPLERKARVAIFAALALIFAGPLFLIGKLVSSRVSGEEEHVFAPSKDQIVILRDGSTMLVRHQSAGAAVAEWFKRDVAGEKTFELSNANFVPGSSKLTQDGWAHLVEFSQLMKAHHEVRALVLFSPYHGDAGSVPLEHSRAEVIHQQVVKQGVDDEQIAVAPETFEPNHNAALDRGLEVVLTNRS